MVNNNPIGINNKPDNDDDEIYNPINHDLTDSSDEQTIDEEEYLAAKDDINDQEEINHLEREKNMPLKDLLALYNYDHENINNNEIHIKTNDIENNFEKTVQNLKLQDSSETNFIVDSHLQELLKPIELNNQEDSVENDPDFVLEADKSEWKTTIMVGKEYQVEIPKINSNYCSTTTPPYENKDLLLWDPKRMTDDEIVQYLINANSSKTSIKQNKTQVKDDAQCLYALMKCDYNVDETLKNKEQHSNFIYDEITPFTDTECLGFEQGLIKHGKDFWKIQQNFVKNRSVKELVHFYYLWKKTERHDAFVIKNRTQKKRYLINPGLTDYMDRFFRDPNNSLKNKENCVKSIPGIINSEQTKVCSNDENDKSANKITRSKSKSNNI